MGMRLCIRDKKTKDIKFYGTKYIDLMGVINYIHVFDKANDLFEVSVE